MTQASRLARVKQAIAATVGSLMLGYSGLCAYGWWFSDRRIFVPPSASYRDTPDILKLDVTDSEQISALHRPNPRADYTFLFSHGNAGDIGNGQALFDQLYALGFSIFAYDYRGYGTSDGSPSEANAYEDIAVAYQYLTQELGIPPNRIIAYGQSLGSGPSIELARQEAIAGLIIEGAFVSIFRVLTRIPLVPFDKFDNLAKIGSVTSPVMVVHGRQDMKIPFWHGEVLYRAANWPKVFLPIDEAGHIDLLMVDRDGFEASLNHLLLSIGATAGTRRSPSLLDSSGLETSCRPHSQMC